IVGEQVIVQGPDIDRVKVGLVQPHQQLRDQEGKAELEEHNRKITETLVAVMSVFQMEFITKGKNGEGVQATVDEPLTCRPPTDPVAQRIEQGYQACIGSLSPVA